MATKNTQPLCVATINKALRDGHPLILKDTGSLCLKIFDKNKGTWIFRGRQAGTNKVVEVTCGSAPETGLRAAREQRDKVRVLLKNGINPNEQKKAKLVEEKIQTDADARTFGVVAEEYFSKRGDMSPKGLQSERGRVKNHMADIRDIPVAQIERFKHLKPLIENLAQREEYEQARRVAGLIHRIMNFAVDMGYIDSSPAYDLVRFIPRSKKNQRHHAALVTEESAASLFQRIWHCCESGRSSLVLTAALKLSCYDFFYALFCLLTKCALQQTGYCLSTPETENMTGCCMACPKTALSQDEAQILQKRGTALKAVPLV